MRPDNEARIIWADSSKKKTAWSIVFLHGFSATWREGDPVVMDLAKRYGCNLFLPRLYAHGLDTADNMVNLTAEKYLESQNYAWNPGYFVTTPGFLLSQYEKFSPKL